MLIYLAVSLVPACVWLWWIYRQDVYEPEPVSLVLSTFFGGMVMALPAILIEWALTKAFIHRPEGIWYQPGTGSFDEAVIYCFAIVAPVEEYLKYRAVRSGAYQSPEFNEPMDGIVYMGSAAVGFATLENALYMRGYGAWILALRIAISTFLHIACSCVIGYQLGIARFKPDEEKWRLRKGFALAITIHGAYDFLALYQPAAGFLALFLLLGGLNMARHHFADDVQAALDESPFKPRSTLMPRKGTRADPPSTPGESA
ncbi:MAG: PrsW family intramembrane metalloprotease [Candidatus Wallbacteria bacterium]|nr:PrsW family intramembrane metalloprotease [Candidatus Wallbacteria bacterium]